MSFVDLRDVLRQWEYDPDKISVRKIRCANGAIQIQQRVEMGIIQMEPTGRPDGVRPFDCESFLEHFEDLHRRHAATFGDETAFELAAEDCHALREESSLYYKRLVASYVLEDYAEVDRDAQHNLEIFAFMRAHTGLSEAVRRFAPWIPYLIMMQTKARVYLAMREDLVESAIAHLNRGLLAVEAHFESVGDREGFAGCDEARLLQSLRNDVAARRPVNEDDRIQRELEAAVREERYEDAARLKTQLGGDGASRGEATA